MSIHSDRFNGMPIEFRKIAINLSIEEEMRCLMREKGRLKSAYQKSCGEINDKINTLGKELLQAEGKINESQAN
tara:strand:- start:54 stop:275 length:222 start_codon:yes stop_codon:yes gene_type:complete